MNGKTRKWAIMLAASILVVESYLAVPGFGAVTSEGATKVASVAGAVSGTAPVAGTDDPGPLVWRPLGFGSAADKVHDLCDDAAAIAAGLDGGTLDEDRRSLGIDCDHAVSSHRYGYLTKSGTMTLGSSPAQAEAGARETSGDGDQEFAVSLPGRALGYFGRSVAGQESVDAVQLVPGSITVRDGSVRGLVQNMSASLFAWDVAVLVHGTRWGVPLTLQPGETAPFEINDYEQADVPTPDAITIESTLKVDIDLDRSLLLTGAPGHWFGNGQDFPGLDGILADLPDGYFHYFESLVEVAEPTSHPSLAALVRDRDIGDLTATVAFFDSDGAVLDVFDVEVRGFDGEHGTSPVDRASPGGSYVIGFVIPDIAADFAVWIGGAK